MAVPISDIFTIPGGPCGKSEEHRTLTTPPTGVKPGIIVYWTGTYAGIPSGWELCDGTDNAAGSGLNLITAHPFNKMESSNAGTYVGKSDLGMSEPHTHVDYTITAEEVRIEVEDAYTDIAETNLDGGHTHPYELDEDGGGHEHGMGVHGHVLEVSDADEYIGSPVGADHDHDDPFNTGVDNINDHTAAEVVACLRRHFDSGHTHSLELEVTASVSGTPNTEDIQTNSVADASYGALDTDILGGGPIADVEGTGTGEPHTETNGPVEHDPHSHPITMDGGTDYVWSHTHYVIPHTHNGELFGPGTHPHVGGKHTHDYQMNPSENHKHGITDAEHKHEGDLDDLHSHNVIHVGFDNGHTHEITISGIMLMPIENIDATATPDPPMGNRTPYTCSESEDRRNFNRCADEPDGLPAGIIIMWSRPVTTIPEGWGLADGDGNSTGSGFNVVNWLIVHTGLDDENGEVWNLNPPKDGGHSHSVTLDLRSFTTELDSASTNITATGAAGSHRHFGTLGDEGSGHDHDGGAHVQLHIPYIPLVQVLTQPSGSHQHSAVATNVVINAHPAVDITDCADLHNDHTHQLIPVENDVEGSGAINTYRGDHRTGGVTDTAATLGHFDSGTTLSHDTHSHVITVDSDGDHFHKSAPHTHVATITGFGNHEHHGGKHDNHDVVDHQVATHIHGIDDPQHTHPIEIGLHSHVAVAGDGRHEHDPALPRRVYLIPIEKLP